jgi:glutamate formiminotransferase
LIKIEAERYGVPVVGSEFCGLAPLRVIVDAVEHYLRIDDFNENKILEVAVQKALEKGRLESE